jgi:hypothetical protein
MNAQTEVTENIADASASRYPFPWCRHNTTLRAANGATVATFPVDGPILTEGIGGVVYRGDIIEQSVNRMSRRRNEWLERRVAALESALRQSVAHWDSVVAAEGTEFNPGQFDSVKDGLEDWRELVTKK